MYTANIVDTVTFRSLGTQRNPHRQSLKRAVKAAETELWVPATIYRELTDYSGDSPVNPYLDDAIEQGWVRVGIPLPGVRSDSFDSVDEPVVKARHLADAYLNQQSKYPVTNNWRDTSLVGLAVRLFERNARIRSITHTADESLAKAYACIPPEFGYYEIESRYYNPPQTAKQAFPTVDALTWDGR